MSARLTADFWVRAYLARLQAAHIPAYVVARGDATAGAVLVKLATLDGLARAFQRRRGCLLRHSARRQQRRPGHRSA